MSSFRPMLANPADFATLMFPVYASAKLDGIRATVHDGKLMSRSMKPIPNIWLQAWCARHAEALDGLDGELIVGSPTAENVFRTTTSHVMSDDKKDFNFSFYVFDVHNQQALGYQDRASLIDDRINSMPTTRAHHWASLLLGSVAELDQFEAEMLDEGYEGVMVRRPDGLYKQGRASDKFNVRAGTGQELLKVKRNDDMEAFILGCEERMHNGNEAYTNELGRTARSSHQANKIGMNTFGAFIVEGLEGGAYSGIEFSVGTGMDDKLRAELWAKRETLKGKIIKVKFFPIGSKDKPRHPVFLGFRDVRDMDAVA